MEIVKLLYGISASILCVSMMLKGIIQIHLNDANGYGFHPFNLNEMLDNLVFLPYDKEVAPKYEKLKRVCNFMQKILVYSFAAAIFWGILTVMFQN